MKIFLNPGHDRQLDSGAVNPVNGLREADVVWDVTGAIVNSIQKILVNNGIDAPIMQNNSLSAVCDVANESGADYFVSVHCNAFNGVAKGTEIEVYSYSSVGNDLAETIQSSIVQKLGTTDRGIKERPGLYVLRNTDMPSVLIELAFIDNAEDVQLLMNRKEDFAMAVASGIMSFLGTPMAAQSGAQATTQVAPNGKPYEQNDIDYLVNKGYSLTDALYTLDMDPKYSNFDILAAAEYARTRVGTTGYGNNGCTEWVRQFLMKANHWFGNLMTDGSQGNLMWVPNIMTYAKEHGIWKEPDQGGTLGDICVLETNYCREDGPDHVVIACGDGNYWGNSSSRNKIVKSSIAGDYGAENVWGYVATGTGANGSVAVGSTNRTAAEIVGDAGSTSYVNLAPNGKVYEENDIQYLLNNGYGSVEAAIEELKKAVKYTAPAAVAPNGKQYEWNDIQYLLDQQYSYDAAINTLSNSDKYLK